MTADQTQRSGPEPPSSRPIATFLATLIGVLYVVPATVFFSLALLLFFWLPPRGWVVSACVRNWARGLLWATGVRVRRHGEAALADRLDGRSCIFLANHQSYFDIPALLVSLPGQVRFAAKRSLFLIPLFGWAMAAGGFIVIDRNDRSSANRSFTAAVRQLRRGISVLFFPEGTRSLDGSLGPFEKGGFLLALRAGLPIVPVGVRGARAVNPRGSLTATPGTIDVHLGEPIDPAEYGVRRREELMEEVRRAIGELAEVEGDSFGWESR